MILLHFETEIAGASDVPEHEGWINVDSFQFGVGRAITVSGRGKDRDTSNPSVSEIVLTKVTDQASSDLFMQACGGKGLGEAEIHFIQTGGLDEGNQVYLILKLADSLVSSYSLSSGGDRPTESFALNFTKISYQYNTFSGTEVTEGTEQIWNVLTNTKE